MCASISAQPYKPTRQKLEVSHGTGVEICHASSATGEIAWYHLLICLLMDNTVISYGVVLLLGLLKPISLQELYPQLVAAQNPALTV